MQRDAQAAVAREYGYESWTQGHVWELEASRGRIVFTEPLDYARPEDNRRRSPRRPDVP